MRFVFLLISAFVACNIEGRDSALEDAEEKRRGSGSGTGSADPFVCCICEYDPSEPYRFEPACQDWVAAHPECDSTSIVPISSEPVCSPSDPSSCDSTLYDYEGHSCSEESCPFIDRISTLCIEGCNAVGATIDGCSTFEDPAAAQAYLESLDLPAGVELSIWGAQCPVDDANDCSYAGCSITYGCTGPPVYDPCPPTGSECFEGTITCMDGSDVSSRCCIPPTGSGSGSGGGGNPTWQECP
jgi:hypothetical protein